MKINDVDKILREHRFVCHKAGLDVTRIDDAIQVWEDIKNGKRVRKAYILRLIAELMDLNPECASTVVTPEYVESLLRLLFPEYLRREQ